MLNLVIGTLPQASDIGTASRIGALVADGLADAGAGDDGLGADNDGPAADAGAIEGTDEVVAIAPQPAMRSGTMSRAILVGMALLSSLSTRD